MTVSTQQEAGKEQREAAGRSPSGVGRRGGKSLDYLRAATRLIVALTSLVIAITGLLALWFRS
ncbi:hypothetical protein Pme01_04350 [Planosporangium mesophilum]|uniref:Uncharacterized protein n=1 Tax=Planosporangium mesophilum TaxID=689768 RepID=A0A8J3X1D6_9ACTN|nr:hypothetical protein Pme01_04350 [Planosporangium mesophilum]